MYQFIWSSIIVKFGFHIHDWCGHSWNHIQSEQLYNGLGFFISNIWLLIFKKWKKKKLNTYNAVHVCSFKYLQIVLNDSVSEHPNFIYSILPQCILLFCRKTKKRTGFHQHLKPAWYMVLKSGHTMQGYLFSISNVKMQDLLDNSRALR